MKKTGSVAEVPRRLLFSALRGLNSPKNSYALPPLIASHLLSLLGNSQPKCQYYKHEMFLPLGGERIYVASMCVAVGKNK